MATRDRGVSSSTVDLPSYVEYAPAHDLATHVACTWSQRMGLLSAGPLAIIPDGCTDVIVVGNAPPQIAGPASQTEWVLPPPGARITGIRLRPGAARSVLGCPADRLQNLELDLRDVCGPSAPAFLSSASRNSRLHDRELRFALENWVRMRLTQVAASDRVALHAARTLTVNVNCSVGALADELGFSARKLHRELCAASGYSPKLLQRVMRVQRVIRLAQQPSQQLGLSALAAACGFADQAHMTRDFHALTSFTPAIYLAGDRSAVGRWLDEEA